MADLNKALRDSAAGPQSFTVDGQTTVEHNLDSQIRAVKFAMATRARSKGGMAGVSITKLKPHGSVLPSCGGE